jgi:hypothetical protein
LKKTVKNGYPSRVHESAEVLLTQIQCIPIKIPMLFLTEIEKNTEIHVKAQKTPNSQSNPEQKEQSCIIT